MILSVVFGAPKFPDGGLWLRCASLDLQCKWWAIRSSFCRLIMIRPVDEPYAVCLVHAGFFIASCSGIFTGLCARTQHMQLTVLTKPRESEEGQIEYWVSAAAAFLGLIVSTLKVECCNLPAFKSLH